MEQLVLLVLLARAILNLAVLISIQVLEVLPERSQLDELRLSLVQLTLTPQVLVLLVCQLLREHLVLVSQDVQVLFQTDHRPIQLIILSLGL